MTSKMEERYEGNFLDALDLPEGALAPVTIETIVEPLTEKDAAGKVIKSAIMSFKGKHKRLILNKTNYKNLKAMFGRDPKDWIGKQVHIQRRYLDAAHAFGVNNTMAIRIVPPIGTPILKSAANFMGSPTPYGPDGKPTKPRGQKPSPQRNHQPPDPKPASPPADVPADMVHWLTGISALDSLQACREFREQMIPLCPETIWADVEKALGAKENSLKGDPNG